MKTTVDIADALLDEAHRIATQDQTTVEDLIEEGLRKIVADKRKRGPFRLRDASFRGEGLQSGLSEGDWETLRALAYEDRGA